nr:folate family ECF transporter S component [uncultured Agathobaculum sp.]
MSNSMSKTPNIFVRSLRELKSTRCLALTALLIAMNIALDLMGLELRLPPDLKIGFGFLANAAVGMLFGPSVAMLAGVCTDLLGYFAGGFTMGGYFPGFTLTAIVAGLFWGLWMYPRRVSLWRAIGAKVCINLFCNIGLNTLWLTLTGGKAMSVLLVARVPKNLLMLPIEIAVLYFGMKLVLRFYHMLPAVRSAERPAGQKLP